MVAKSTSTGSGYVSEAVPSPSKLAGPFVRKAEADTLCSGRKPCRYCVIIVDREHAVAAVRTAQGSTGLPIATAQGRSAL